MTANKTFFTFSLIHSSGRNLARFKVVIQAAALVFNEKFLYFWEFKKVISLFPADTKSFISWIKLWSLDKSLVALINSEIFDKGNGPLLPFYFKLSEGSFLFNISTKTLVTSRSGSA